MVISLAEFVHLLSQPALSTILASIEETCRDVDLLLYQIVNALSSWSDEGPLHVLKTFGCQDLTCSLSSCISVVAPQFGLFTIKISTIYILSKS